MAPRFSYNDLSIQLVEGLGCVLSACTVPVFDFKEPSPDRKALAAREKGQLKSEFVFFPVVSCSHCVLRGVAFSWMHRRNNKISRRQVFDKISRSIIFVDAARRIIRDLGRRVESCHRIRLM